MKPSIGRIVHFVYNGQCFAAIITYVIDDNSVNLFVFDDGRGNLLGNIHTFVLYNADKLAGSYTWHWPERVE